MREIVVAIYARISSDRQIEGSTIESRVGALQKRITLDGFPLADGLTFLDEGYSGASLVCPGLERLRNVVA